MPLSLVDLNDALSDASNLVRAQGQLDPDDFKRIALDYGIKPDVLRKRFYERFPDGIVPTALPSEEVNDLRRLRRALEKASAYAKHVGMFDGREFTIAGAVYTVIYENKGTARLHAINHATLEEVSFSFAEIKRLSEKREIVARSGSNHLPPDRTSKNGPEI